LVVGGKMGCSWYEPDYWMAWPSVGQFLWLILLVGFGFLVYGFTRNRRQASTFKTMEKVQETCPNCHAFIEKAFICCPECHYKLKTNCNACGRIVKTSWVACPHCEADLIKTKEAEFSH
jgi:RNA polymerase subunit RPABC4/transcription elongation factor Spt4